MKCNECDYTANLEKAESILPEQNPGSLEVPSIWLESNIKEIELLLRLITAEASCQAWISHNHVVLFVVPKSRLVNEVKFEQISSMTGKKWIAVSSKSSFPGETLEIIIDDSVPLDKSLVATLSESGVKINRQPIILSHAGDGCTVCAKEGRPGILIKQNGIEVGHTFYLGTKYSLPLSATFKHPDQKTVPIEMGCYGIGVSRMIASVVEASHDENGIIWPRSISPYSVLILPNYKKKCERADNYELEERLFSILLSVPSIARHIKNGDAVIDDTDQSSGYKMKDALLIGYPHIIVASKSFMVDGLLEVHTRATGEVVTTKNIDELDLLLQ